MSLQVTHIIDVCGTLFWDDTTVGLLRYHLLRRSSRRFRLFVFYALTSPYSPLYLAFVFLEKLLSRHLLKHILVRLLVGDLESEINQSASQYAQYLLAFRKINLTWTIFETSISPDQIILASSSLQPIVRALANAMGCRFVASNLETRGGALTGKYLSDLTGRKEGAITSKYGIEVLAMPFIAISDNYSDIALLKKSLIPYVILHKGRHRSRWQSINARFLYPHRLD